MLYNTPLTLFHLAWLKLYIHSTATSHFPFSPAPILHSASMCLTILDTEFTWNDAVLSFCDWLISRHIMSSSFIHVVVYGRILSFLRLNNIPLCVYTTFSSYSHLLRHMNYFHTMVIVNIAAMNMRMQRIEWWFSQGICPVVGLLGHMVVLFLVF